MMTSPVYRAAEAVNQTQRLVRLEAIEAVRALFARYMQLCDVPRQPAATAESLAALFAEDATWKGVGHHYQEKFGRLDGATAICAMLMSYLPPNPHFAFNGHFLASEHIEAEGDRARGQWLMQQISTYEDERSELIVARLVIDFAREGSTWRITLFQSECLGKFPLQSANRLETDS